MPTKRHVACFTFDVFQWAPPKIGMPYLRLNAAFFRCVSANRLPIAIMPRSKLCNVRFKNVARAPDHHNVGFLGRWGTHACPQCLPSDTVPIRSWTRTLRRHRMSATDICHTMPCHTIDNFEGRLSTCLMVIQGNSLNAFESHTPTFAAAQN